MLLCGLRRIREAVSHGLPRAQAASTLAIDRRDASPQTPTLPERHAPVPSAARLLLARA
jgi:hypothetical protein